MLLAQERSSVAGFATLCESHTLYAGGAFGIVQEFHVAPPPRTVHAPLPAFERTPAFHESNGFAITGGHKMQCAVDGA